MPDEGRAGRTRLRVRTLTKSRIVEGIRESTGLPRADALALLEDLIELMKDALENGEQVKVSGFGSFLVRTKSARRGRNPQTGGAIHLPRRRVLTFKPSRMLRERIQEGEADGSSPPDGSSTDSGSASGQRGTRG
jgi:integration host factor subunit alpha